MHILVVDDHSLFREGLISLLKASGIDVVGEAGDGESAVNETLRLKPDIVLMDLHMPVMNGLDALRIIHEKSPETKVVMLTVSDRTEDLMAAIENGASGYLLKSLDARTFIASLQGLERGEAAISREMTTQLMGQIAQRAKQPSPSNMPRTVLSSREVELLQYISRGLPNKAIAQELSISENTVKYHLKHILQKLGLKNRSEAAAYAVQHRLVKE